MYLLFLELIKFIHFPENFYMVVVIIKVKLLIVGFYIQERAFKPAHEIMSHRRPAKAQVSLRIRAVSPEPLLFTRIIMEVDEGLTKNQTSSHTGWLRMCV